MGCCGIESRGCYNSDLNSKNKCIETSFDKLHVYDWLKNIKNTYKKTDIVEVRFKNTLKEYFINSNDLNLKKGDVIAVEAAAGHNVGIVSLTGELVFEQLQKNKISIEKTEFKKIYRKAKQSDIEKWKESIAKEKETMLKARKIAKDLKLDMKIGDVEFQGDKTKAIFYYIAEQRVDFRELIKILAEEFKIRIEMRQIGSRQEAGKIGGIGSCGRELCCSSWMNNFNSVSTNSARTQEISLNPQKLAGQCGKLKCCLNYELDTYEDAKKDFPKTDIPLVTEIGTAYYQKTDVFKELYWYAMKNESGINNFYAVPVDRVREIQEINKKGNKVDVLIDTEVEITTKSETSYGDILIEDSITRFDNANKNRKRKKKKRKNRKPNRNPNNKNNNAS